MQPKARTNLHLRAVAVHRAVLEPAGGGSADPRTHDDQRSPIADRQRLVQPDKDQLLGRHGCEDWSQKLAHSMKNSHDSWLLL